MTRTRLVSLGLAVGVLVGAWLAWPVTAQPPAPMPYLDPDLDFEARARDLVSRMTVEDTVESRTRGNRRSMSSASSAE